MIIKDSNILKEKCADVFLLESEQIIKKLKKELKNSISPGIGLAAPQIGIKKKFVLYERQNVIWI